MPLKPHLIEQSRPRPWMNKRTDLFGYDKHVAGIKDGHITVLISWYTGGLLIDVHVSYATQRVANDVSSFLGRGLLAILSDSKDFLLSTRIKLLFARSHQVSFCVQFPSDFPWIRIVSRGRKSILQQLLLLCDDKYLVRARISSDDWQDIHYIRYPCRFFCFYRPKDMYPWSQKLRDRLVITTTTTFTSLI